MIKFEYLFYFTSPYVDIVEIKCLGPQFVTPAQTYKWLMIEKNSQQMQQLQFVSMDRNGLIEHRIFTQGAFQFDEHQAEFKSNDLNLALERKKTELVPEFINILVQKLLGNTH